MMRLTKRVSAIKLSPTLAVTAKAAAMRAEGIDVIGLGAGEPDFPSSPAAKQAGIDAIHADKTHYTPVDGIPELKQAVAQKLAEDENLTYTPEQILISVGAKQALFNLALAVLEEGDEAIIPAPYWVSYPDIVTICGAKPVPLFAGKEMDFKISAAMLTAALSQRTRLLFINSPSNPTGKCYTRAELKALGEVLAEYPDVVIASDDIYRHILWNGEFCNILNVCPQLAERTVIINGVSKSHAMTGWRIGWAAGPAELIRAMKKVQSQSTSNPASISQRAALGALTADLEHTNQMVAQFQQRHQIMLSGLTSIDGIECVPADGAFYLFPSVEALIKRLPNIKDDVDFCSYVLEKARVALVPGSAFGAPGYARVSYATSTENLQRALERLQSLLQ